MFDPTLNSIDFFERFSAGDHKASVDLWEYGGKRFINLYRYMGFTLEQAEDVWSETYINLLETRCVTYNPRKAPFLVWLTVVAKRAGLYRLRDRARYQEIPLDACSDIPSNEIFVEENKSGQSESHIQIRRATASLTKSDRAIILERFVEKLPFDLIAEKRGISESAARMRTSRALNRLRQKLERSHSRELPRRIRQAGQRNPPRAAPTENY